MADGIDGGVVDYSDWKHVSAVYFNDQINPYKKGEENSRMVQYWISLKSGGLVECETKYSTFETRLGLKYNIKGIRNTVPVIKVKGKPFLPSGDTHQP